MSHAAKPNLIILNLILLNFCCGLIYAALPSKSYIVSLQQNGTHFCGGTLIAPSWVLTSAMCLNNISASDIDVLIGSYHSSGGGLKAKVNETRTYDDPYVGSYLDDVALLKLDRKMQHTFAELPEVGDYPAEGEILSVYGYGQLQENGENSQSLMYIEIPAISMTECRAVYGDDLISDSMFCAYEMYKDACQGDGGGPAIAVNGIQYGIISWGMGCARPGIPGVYTQIGNSWIRSWIYRNAKV